MFVYLELILICIAILAVKRYGLDMLMFYTLIATYYANKLILWIYKYVKK